jgi:4-oxalmesaconate hydratase
VIPVENILFASEMIGAVRGIDPETGFNYDDTKRYIEASEGDLRVGERQSRGESRSEVKEEPARGRGT